jgi:hypothetical protein
MDSGTYRRQGERSSSWDQTGEVGKFDNLVLASVVIFLSDREEISLLNLLQPCSPWTISCERGICGSVPTSPDAALFSLQVFVVFFAGERARTKILKLCEAVGANRYPFPEDRSRQRHMNAEVTIFCTCDLHTVPSRHYLRNKATFFIVDKKRISATFEIRGAFSPLFMRIYTNPWKSLG